MTSAVQERADAANDSYANRPQSDVDSPKGVFLDGQKYRVFGYANDPISGFHATAYQSVDKPHSIIIAYRGTDPALFSGTTPAEKRDHALTTVQDIAVDATMVRDSVNPQKGTADAFTQAMIDKAARQGIPKDHVFVAGHSLGGTLAEIEAAKFGLTGSTYNAFGAAGLTDGPPQPGCQLTNYRMAGDVVSAANAHVGEVVSLASKEDVQSARDGRYLDAPSGSPPPNALIAMRLDDHGGQQHFDSKSADNILEPSRFREAAQRYADNKPAFDHFSGDVSRERGELSQALKQMENHYGQNSLPPDVQRQVNEYLALHADQPIRHAIEQNGTVQGTEQRLQHGADAARAAGHYVQAQDEHVASAARKAGAYALPLSPLAPLVGLAAGEAAHLHGQAADATGRFVGGQFESAKGAVEHGAHNVAQAALGTIHNPGVQAGAANVVNRIVDTYHNAQATAQAATQTYEATKQVISQTVENTERAAAKTYDAAKQTVTHGIDRAEHAAGQAFDTLSHPGQLFHGSSATPHVGSNAAPPPAETQRPYDPRHPDHPQHAQYEKTAALVAGAYAKHGIAQSPEQLERTTAHVMYNAQKDKLDIKDVQLNRDLRTHQIGPNSLLIAFSGHNKEVTSMRSFTDVPQAQRAAPEQTFQQLAHLQQQQAQAPQQPTPPQIQGPGGPGMGGPGGR